MGPTASAPFPLNYTLYLLNVLSIVKHIRLRIVVYLPFHRTSQKSLWQYSHTVSIFCAVLLFTAGFLCVLLWTNNIVHTETTNFTQFSPAVSTFSITYSVVCT